MPELPEVETTRRGLKPHLEHQQVKQLKVRNPNLRWPVDAGLPRRLKDAKLVSLERRGKYLLLNFTKKNQPLGTALWHLGMSGSLRIVSQSEPVKKHDHIDLVMADGIIARFNDPRRFGALVWTEEAVEQHALISHLGPEPLFDEFTTDYLYQKSRKRQRDIKQFIMDSKIVVGVGNIYANESLFLAGIRPTVAAGKVSRARMEKFHGHIVAVLAKAIKQGGTTLKDFVGGDGKPGYFQQQLHVYGRGGLPCTVCQKPLKEIQLGKRTTVYCTACQK